MSSGKPFVTPETESRFELFTESIEETIGSCVGENVDLLMVIAEVRGNEGEGERGVILSSSTIEDHVVMALLHDLLENRATDVHGKRMRVTITEAEPVEVDVPERLHKCATVELRRQDGEFFVLVLGEDEREIDRVGPYPSRAVAELVYARVMSRLEALGGTVVGPDE